MTELLLDDDSKAVIESLRTLLKEGNSGNLVAFAGAGLSAQAGLPLWNQLIKDLGDATGLVGQGRSGIEQVNQYDPLWHAEECGMRLEQRATYQTFLARKFGAALPAADNAIEALIRLNFRHFLTTNYDLLLEQAYDKLAAKESYGQLVWTNRQ